ncbi:MAG: protein phosphatase CheZ [Gammaproteobacteria bacterium]|nr:protein phosphatase CheZ [Gammaproteobacteria bacterium]MBU0770696.1 protein phosphatase CheZ [Gammaproteobacteria bacterium]MBU0857570.1 protein phosphatase CheZ [Gammaproteobacteria bacterium]MBU1848686.1 protein phosphatase CheZ [Gammaproteobacteria bacterium]
MKKLKVDETGDSDDLQALFDSIASETPQKVRLEVVAEAANSANGSGDGPDLEALFESVSDEYATSHEVPEASGEMDAAAAAAADEHSCDAVFNRVGHLARQLHDTLRQLGYDDALEEVANQMPDARSRLNYVAQMTEKAASRVLNATDVAIPLQDDVEARSSGLHDRWEKLYRNELSPEEFKALASETRAFLGDVPGFARDTRAQLNEIMMAQDFQDLTGQVIKKVVEMSQKLESGLVQVLIESMPAAKRASAPEGLLNGPVINAEGRDDVVSNQEQVDDLLESLGF